MSQTTQTSLSELRRSGNGNLPVEAAAPPVPIGMDTVQGFEGLQRIAKLFAASDIVPPQYKSLPNAVIAVDMALRMGANPLLVTQNLYVVHNRPSWSAKFLIATFNKGGRYTSISYEFQGKEGTDEWGCRAVTSEKVTGQKELGPLVTIGMAKAEGWFGRNGSKWKTMPELMLRYRAATFLVNTIAPEISMGLQTVEEVHDTYDLEATTNGKYEMTSAEIGPAAAASEHAPEPPAKESEKPTAPPKAKGNGKAAASAAAPAEKPTPEPEPEPAQAPAPATGEVETKSIAGKVLEKATDVYLFEIYMSDGKGFAVDIPRSEIVSEPEGGLEISVAYYQQLLHKFQQQQVQE
jgi:hypothetical protein